MHSTEDFLEKIGSLFHTAESSRKGSYIIPYYEDCRGHLFYKEFPHVCRVLMVDCFIYLNHASLQVLLKSDQQRFE